MNPIGKTFTKFDADEDLHDQGVTQGAVTDIAAGESAQHVSESDLPHSINDPLASEDYAVSFDGEFVKGVSLFDEVGESYPSKSDAVVDSGSDVVDISDVPNPSAIINTGHVHDDGTQYSLAIELDLSELVSATSKMDVNEFGTTTKTAVAKVRQNGLDLVSAKIISTYTKGGNVEAQAALADPGFTIDAVSEMKELTESISFKAVVLPEVVSKPPETSPIHVDIPPLAEHTLEMVIPPKSDTTNSDDSDADTFYTCSGSENSSCMDGHSKLGTTDLVQSDMFAVNEKLFGEAFAPQFEKPFDALDVHLTPQNVFNSFASEAPFENSMSDSYAFGYRPGQHNCGNAMTAGYLVQNQPVRSISDKDVMKEPYTTHMTPSVWFANNAEVMNENWDELELDKMDVNSDNSEPEPVPRARGFPFCCWPPRG